MVMRVGCSRGGVAAVPSAVAGERVCDCWLQDAEEMSETMWESASFLRGDGGFEGQTASREVLGCCGTGEALDWPCSMAATLHRFLADPQGRWFCCIYMWLQVCVSG